MTLGAEAGALQPEPRGAPGHPAARSQEGWGVSHRGPRGLSPADTWPWPRASRGTGGRARCPCGRARDDPPWPQE